MNHIRHSAKGVVISKDKILLIKNQTPHDTWYTLPGGGPNHKENLHQALKREVHEETGVPISVMKLLFIREYIGQNHEFSQYDKDVHTIEIMFLCHPHSNDISILMPDRDQVSAVWADIADICSINLYPKSLKKKLAELTECGSMQNLDPYLGDVN